MNPAGQKLATGHDDAWIPSACALCYGSCSILAHRMDGVVVKIEGNPDSAVGKGRLCGKGVAGIASHYDPNRLRVPLRRTNPKKGLDQDPGWKEISWDEALDEITAVLKRVRAEDPRKLVMQRTTTVTASRIPFQTFGAAFGTPHISTAGGGLHCGNGAHLISGIMHASWGIVPDFRYCNYSIYFGASKGHSAGHVSNTKRVPIYWEFLPPVGEKIAAIAEPRGLKIPRQYYEPLPDFLPCKSHTSSAPGFDFYAFYYRDVLHTNSYTLENPWLDEAAQLDPYSYYAAINVEAGRRRGLADGQMVWIETETGRKVKGRLKLSQAIHPEGLGIAACAGHWSEGMPIAKGKGIMFNDLLELDWEHTSPVNLNLDLCVRVKLTSA